MELDNRLILIVDLRLFIHDILFQPEVCINRIQSQTLYTGTEFETLYTDTDFETTIVRSLHELLYAIMSGRNMSTKPKEMA